MLKLLNITKIFQTAEIETCALNSINFEIQTGDFISVMGPSGCGKSTLLNVIGLLDNPTSGKLIIDEIEMLNMPDKELAYIRNEKFGFVFQSFHLINGLSILQNVELPLLYSRNRFSSKEIKDRAKDVLNAVGLSSRINHFPNQLSGGQCQRTAIARAIIMNPSIVLADEPTGNLDSKMGKEIINLLTELNSKGTTIVMVTHDESLSLRAKRRIFMVDGEIKQA
jgi:putative ABC transport system ATP-binding protein